MREPEGDCVICRSGRFAPGKVTVTLERGATIVIVKGVPAQVCTQCGEYLLDEATSDAISDRAESAVRDGVELTIQRYSG